jgi:hypothetical protein
VLTFDGIELVPTGLTYIGRYISSSLPAFFKFLIDMQARITKHQFAIYTFANHISSGLSPPVIAITWRTSRRSTITALSGAKPSGWPPRKLNSGHVMAHDPF